MAFKQYRSQLPYLRTTTPKGKDILFQGGMFFTDDPECIEWLDTFKFIKDSMITPIDGEFSADQVDPLEAIKKKAIEEYLASVKAQAEPQNRGNSTDKFVVGTSVDLPSEVEDPIKTKLKSLKS
jgi:hypothetical protein